MNILRNKQVDFFLKAELSHLILIYRTAFCHISEECHMVFLIMAFIDLECRPGPVLDIRTHPRKIVWKNYCLKYLGKKSFILIKPGFSLFYQKLRKHFFVKYYYILK